MNARVLYHLIRADFLERVRRYSFFVTLLVTLYLGYLAWTGRIHLSSHGYSGIANSAWTGTMMTLTATTFLTLCGFYVVRQSVERDRSTRVGPILAATPISSFEYLLGKMLSNFAVLASMVGVLAVSAVILQVVRAESAHLDLITMLTPFVVIALPAMVLLAAVAVLFDVVPGLRSGAGNVIYFFVWSIGSAICIQFCSRNPAFADFDPFGFGIVMRQLGDAVAGFADKTSGEGLSFNISDTVRSVKTFPWNGIVWTSSLLISRLLWLGVAVSIVALAARFFHRFDPTREKLSSDSTVKKSAAAAVPSNAPIGAYRPLSRLAPADRGGDLLALFTAELRLDLKGKRWWWYAGCLAFIAAPLFGAPPSGVVIGACLWPVLVLSPLGSREAHYETETLIFNSPVAGALHVFASWMAGVTVCLVLFSGALVRMALARDPHFVGVCVAAAFIPALAVALGTASGGSKLFEAVYVAAWYTGPLHATPGIEFSGATVAADPVRFAVVAALLLASAVAARVVRQRVIA